VIAHCDNCARTRKAHYQDVLHGTGRRVWNQGKSKWSTGLYRCTVCGDERDFSATAAVFKEQGKAKKAGAKKAGKKGKKQK